MKRLPRRDWPLIVLWTAVIGGAIAAVILMIASAWAVEYSGRPERIVDGDTFWICNASACTKIRLCGIDAPERGEPGAAAATDALTSLLAGREVRCVQVGAGTPCDGRTRPTNGDRVVAQCFAGGIDVAEPMVRDGHACDWVRFSGGHYSTGGAGVTCP